MADFVELIGRMDPGFLSRCAIPQDVESVVDRGHEDSPRAARTSRRAVEEVWDAALALYRSGVHPAVQVCIRRNGATALHRAVGHARGNAPGAPSDAHKVPVTVGTPINAFSSSKAVTAMLIHKLDERRELHVDDRVSEYLPEFAKHGKEEITIRHLLAHRAGIPNVPSEVLDLELLGDPDRVLQVLCDLEPSSPPGRLLAYHAISAGFILGEIAQRVSGLSFDALCKRELRDPLGLEWMHYGVKEADVARVAENAFTGPPMVPPISTLLTRALGVPLPEAVEISNDPRFLTGLIPSANLATTARDMATFYQCLLDDGMHDGKPVFEPRTIHRAIHQQSVWEVDLTLAMPISYGSGFMLGNRGLSPYGWNHPNAFGHLGLTNILCWADPDRDLVVSVFTTGKPVVSLHALRLVQLVEAIHEAFPPLSKRAAGARRTRLRAVPS